MDNSTVYVVWWKDLLLYQQAQHWFTMGHLTTPLPITSYHTGSYIRLIHTFIHCKDRIPQHYVEFSSVFPIICRSLQPELLEKVVNRALKSAEVPNDMVTLSQFLHCMKLDHIARVKHHYMAPRGVS